MRKPILSSGRWLVRRAVAIVLLTSAGMSPVLAQRVIRDTNTSQPLNVRWANALTDARATGESFALGMSFERLMSTDYYFQRTHQWEMHTNGRRRSDGPSLMQMANGQIPEEDQMTTAEAVRRTARMVLVELGRLERKETLVLREVGVVVTYHAGNAVNVWMGNMELNPQIDAPVLHWFGHANPQSSMSLFQSLYSDSNSRIREGVIAAIGALTSPDDVIPFLARVLRSDADENVRDEAASWLGRQADTRALPPLIAAANGDKSRKVQTEAVEAIGELLVDGSLEALLQIVDTHGDVRVRQEAVEAIANHRSPEAARALERIARNDKTRSVQKEAIEGLGDMPPQLGTTLLTALLATHPVASIRAEAAETLGDRPSDETVEALKQAVMHDQSTAVRNEALEALADMSGGFGIAAVIDIAMNHPSRDTKREAIELLGDSKDSRARAALVTIGGR